LTPPLSRCAALRTLTDGGGSSGKGEIAVLRQNWCQSLRTQVLAWAEPMQALACKRTAHPALNRLSMQKHRYDLTLQPCTCPSKNPAAVHTSHMAALAASVLWRGTPARGSSHWLSPHTSTLPRSLAVVPGVARVAIAWRGRAALVPSPTDPPLSQIASAPHESQLPAIPCLP